MQRNLSQYKNGSAFAPKPDDILVFGPSVFNDYGHVAIVIQLEDRTVQIMQQNVGCKTRAKLKIELRDNGYWFDNKRVLGWLRKE